MDSAEIVKALRDRNTAVNRVLNMAAADHIEALERESERAGAALKAIIDCADWLEVVSSTSPPGTAENCIAAEKALDAAINEARRVLGTERLVCPDCGADLPSCTCDEVLAHSASEAGGARSDIGELYFPDRAPDDLDRQFK